MSQTTREISLAGKVALMTGGSRRVGNRVREKEGMCPMANVVKKPSMSSESFRLAQH
jgi:hypothetical protein